MGAALAPIGRATTVPKEIYASPKLHVSLKFRFRADAITLCHPALGECGILDKKTANTLIELIKDDLSLEFEALPDHDLLPPSSQRRMPIFTLPLQINVYGPFASSDRVASALSEAQVFLQEPIKVHPLSAYRNPHFLSWDAHIETPQLRQVCLPPSVDMLAQVHEILHQSNDIRSSDLPHQDCRINTVLHESVSQLTPPEIDHY